MKPFLKWLGAAAIAVSTTANSGTLGRYRVVPLENLDLNRTAKTLAHFQLMRFPNAHTGFVWNAADNNTAKWRPQGIAGIAAPSRKYLLVSWYGREQADYDNRGARVSVVDVTNMESVKYRHILLVDTAGKPFHGLHAGGLAYRHGKLYVPDTRAGGKLIYEFSMDAIREVPVSERAAYFGYRYLLQQRASYAAPIPPSFLSYDWDRDLILTGTFFKCSDAHQDTTSCRSSAKNRLSWFDVGGNKENLSVCAPFYSEMQSAAATFRVLWVVSSYGRHNASHLHISRINGESCPEKRSGVKSARIVVYPPGLEDMHLALTSDNIWMLTEFGPHEGILNNRVVFATKKGRLMPQP